MVRLTVSDTGLGVSRDQQSLLFHKFQQAGSSSLTHDPARGTGLGLYISRLLAQEMSGNLELERSELGRGSVFALEVPVATPARVKRLAPKPATVDSHRSSNCRKAVGWAAWRDERGVRPSQQKPASAGGRSLATPESFSGVAILSSTKPYIAPVLVRHLASCVR